jgi:hypothetical protein
MMLRDIELLPAAEQWVKDAVAKHSDEKRELVPWCCFQRTSVMWSS